jgi:hypothetical protein
MSDQHQVNSIIAAAISDARKDHPDGRIDPEEAKQVARASLRSPIRFPQISSPALMAVPVTLPPGRAMFETSPIATGSDEIVTIGIVVVAALNARPRISARRAHPLTDTQR